MYSEMARSQLPSLNSLRAFEATARLMSFKQAATELNVTPAAIGHQVKGLEEYYGVPLFVRANRSLTLTKAGLGCLPELRRGFSQLSNAAEKLRTYKQDLQLSVTAAPSFAAKWLIPRLHSFRKLHPDINVRIDTDVNELDLKDSTIDIGIRFGSGSYSKLNVDRLMGETLIPVCSPEILAHANTLRTPADLANHTLLHIEGETSDTMWPDWQDWLDKAGISSVDPDLGQHFTQSLMAVQAAIDGNGVALAPYSIVADDLNSKRLVRLFTEIPGIQTSFAFYLVSVGELDRTPALTAFCNWVKDQVSEFEVMHRSHEV
jgi:LysR family glycine cleavage system transcriptional activator